MRQELMVSFIQNVQDELMRRYSDGRLDGVGDTVRLNVVDGDKQFNILDYYEYIERRSEMIAGIEKRQGLGEIAVVLMGESLTFKSGPLAGVSEVYEKFNDDTGEFETDYVIEDGRYELVSISEIKELCKEELTERFRIMSIANEWYKLDVERPDVKYSEYYLGVSRTKIDELRKSIDELKSPIDELESKDESD